MQNELKRDPNKISAHRVYAIINNRVYLSDILERKMGNGSEDESVNSQENDNLLLGYQEFRVYNG